MDSLIRKTRIKEAQFTQPLWILTRIILFVLPALLIFPHTALSINQAVGGQNLEQNAVVPDGQQAQEFADEQGSMQAQDYGVHTNLDGDMDPADFDLIIEVPVVLENLYPQVSRYVLRCSVGKHVTIPGGWNFETGTRQMSTIYVIIENGTYEGLFRFFFAIPQDQTPDDLNYFDCRSYLGSLNLAATTPIKYEAAPEDYPAWALLAPESTLSMSWGVINW